MGQRRKKEIEVPGLEAGMSAFLALLDLHLAPALDAHCGKVNAVIFGAKGYDYISERAAIPTPALMNNTDVEIRPIGWPRGSIIYCQLIKEKSGWFPHTGSVRADHLEIPGLITPGFRTGFTRILHHNPREIVLRSTSRGSLAGKIFNRAFTHRERETLGRYLRIAHGLKIKPIGDYPILMAAMAGKYRSQRTAERLIKDSPGSFSNPIKAFAEYLDLPMEVLGSVMQLPGEIMLKDVARKLESYEL